MMAAVLSTFGFTVMILKTRTPVALIYTEVVDAHLIVMLVASVWTRAG